MNQREQREEAVFEEALQLPKEQRAAYLDKTCAGDLELRRRVEALLGALGRASGFLKDPALPRAEATMVVNLPPAAKAGDKIGHYKLLQQIGEGGCGVVFMAEQEEPVHRRVALKIIKVGMDTKQVIARFEAERQALALMDHPNIAKVLDAGATETGRPYFVMDLVRGIKITDFCDEHQLSTQERLLLFVQVCQAVQHAHQKGIIHRDIKPSNILVTINEPGSAGVPKVIDFGIAKATQGKLTEQTVFTAFEQFIGTPAYMSPEQAVMTTLDVDTRTDIYSLGVLLYELLTGKTPLDSKKLLEAGLDEMRRTIREKEPVRPSTRLSTMMVGELNDAARHRHETAPKLIHLVRGDLDWIVMKCLEKDRSRRYETANGLAMDILRHLRNELVVARPPSKVYRFQKFVRRNKAAFAAAGVIVVTLFGALAISTYSLAREKQASGAARAEADKREQLARFLQDLLARISSQVAQGLDTSKLKAVLAQTSSRFAENLKERPGIEAELWAAVGAIYLDLGDYGTAAPKFEQALRLKSSVGETDSKAVADLFNMLGNALEMRGDFDQAEPALRKAMGLKKRLYGELSAEYADPLSDLGLLLWYRGDLQEAENLTRPSVELKRKLPGGKKDLAASIGNLGTILWEQGRFKEAEQNLKEALEMSKTFQLQPGDIGLASMNLALVKRDQGNLPDAERLFREAIGLLPEAHPYAVRSHLYLAGVLRRGAAFSSDQKLLTEALRLNPADPFTADALAAIFARSNLSQLCSSDDTPWRFTLNPASANWVRTNFNDANWTSCPSMKGMAAYAPYSPRIDRSVRFHTNVWLRREFELPNVPTGKLVFALHRCHDAEIFVNEVQAAPVSDWSDTLVLLPCSARGEAAIRTGKNLMAVHCREIDGGTSVGVGIYSTTDPSLGRIKLLEKYNELLQAEPQRADLYSGRANACARLSRWKDAGADLNHAMTLAPDSIADWFQLATLLVQLGDSAGYARHRREGLGQFSQPANPTMAAQVVVGALITPMDAEESESLMKLADFAASASYGDKGLVLRQMAKGLAAFRQARYTTAIEWLSKAQISAQDPDLIGWNHERQRNRTAAACLVQAMAQYRSFHSSEAQMLLARGKEIIQTQLPETTCGDLGREWPEWIIAQTFLHQAEELIEGRSTKEDSK